ncbi:MAG: hypothetical protein IJV03_03910 [Alphaproteobacteria bacterium]|nr:hypothetical protein [Alphaproteobacteria bacterium]
MGQIIYQCVHLPLHVHQVDYHHHLYIQRKHRYLLVFLHRALHILAMVRVIVRHIQRLPLHVHQVDYHHHPYIQHKHRYLLVDLHHVRRILAMVRVIVLHIQHLLLHVHQLFALVGLQLSFDLHRQPLMQLDFFL